MPAYVVPTICAPISNQMIQFTQKTYPHLHGPELADNSHGSEELSVDLLIGADFYWHLVTGETVRDVNPGPVAILTKPGYVLSGPVNVSIHNWGAVSPPPSLTTPLITKSFVWIRALRK